MTQEKRGGLGRGEFDADASRGDGREPRDDCYAARVENGRLLVDAPTRFRDGTEVPLDLGFDDSPDELTPEQDARMAQYEGRLYAGVVRNGRLVVDEPTLLPDGIRIMAIESWPLPPEEQAKLEAMLDARISGRDDQRDILGDDVLEAMRIREALAPEEREECDAECDAELDRRSAVTAPGAWITVADDLARWRDGGQVATRR